MNLAQEQQKRWIAVLEALINADPDEGMRADELAELPAFKRRTGEKTPSERSGESDTQRVLRALHDMAEAGLLKKGLLLSAFVRHKVKMHSQLIFERTCALEEAMLKAMRELTPDAISLLRGDNEILGTEPDELRDRLLAERGRGRRIPRALPRRQMGGSLGQSSVPAVSVSRGAFELMLCHVAARREETVPGHGIVVMPFCIL